MCEAQKVANAVKRQKMQLTWLCHYNNNTNICTSFKAFLVERVSKSVTIQPKHGKKKTFN